MASSGVPPFDPRGSKYDQKTYWGRVRHFMEMVDLRNAFITEDEVKSAEALLRAYNEAGNRLPPGASDADMWSAKRKADAVLHPDTHTHIPLPFRMSMFMPANLPISAGMILSGTGPLQLVFQWLNQSYNAGFNYFNRSISAEEAAAGVQWGPILTSYTVATGTAVGMAYALGRVVARMQQKVGGGGGGAGSIGMKVLSRALPWFAVASAGAANAVAMLYPYAVNGVMLEDEDGNPQGKSVVAGRNALAQIALTRVVLPIPILLIPPFVLDAARAAPVLGKAMASNKGVSLLVELGVIGIFLQNALPFAVAVFPQRGSISADKLEPEFRARKDAAGRPLDVYYFNKGV